MSRRARRLRQLLESDPVDRPDYTLSMDIWRVFGRTDYAYVKEVAPWAYDKINDRLKVAIESAVELDQDLRAIAGQALTPRDWTPLFDHLNVDLSTRALESGGNLAAILAKLDVALSTRARLQPWYQTNFAVQNQNYYNVGLAPHSWTTRWTYTVPANRIAIVRCATIIIMRRTAATSSPIIGGKILIDDATYVMNLQLNTNGVWDNKSDQVGESAILRAGSTLQGASSDYSNGGTSDFILSANVMEFDT